MPAEPPKRAPFKRQTGAVAPSTVTSPGPAPAKPAKAAFGAAAAIPDAGLVRQAIRSSPGAWFETYGIIWDKEGNVIGYAQDKELTLNKMQQELDEIYAWCEANGIPCKIVTLKARQAGSSTWSVAALYHFAQRWARAKVCIIGDTYERSVKNLEAMFFRFASEDKFPWGTKFDKPSRKFSHGSELTTETANSNRAGASGTLRGILMTETAHWLETQTISAKKVLAALLNCMPKGPGTLTIMESTPNGVGGIYYDTFQKAVTFEDIKAGRIPADWNRFIRVFYAWHEHPEYTIEHIIKRDMTTAEVAEIMDNLSEREMEMLQAAPKTITPGRLAWRRVVLASPDFNGDEEMFEQENPFDPVRCFLMSGRRAFSLLKLEQMRKWAVLHGAEGTYPRMLKWADAREDRSVMVPCADEDAFIKIWEKPKAGQRYSISVDPASGVAVKGEDPDHHGLQVWREGCLMPNGSWLRRKMVARITDFHAEKRLNHEKAHCRWGVQLTIERIALAAAYYGWCQVVVEANIGLAMIEGLRRYPRMRLYQREMFLKIEQTTAKEYGWMTTEKTRPLILDNLQQAVREWDSDGTGLEVLDLPTINEMMTMIVKDNGRGEAMKGHHDDQVLSAAIGLQTLPGGSVMPVPRAQFQPQPGKPRDSTFRP